MQLEPTGRARRSDQTVHLKIKIQTWCCHPHTDGSFWVHESAAEHNKSPCWLTAYTLPHWMEGVFVHFINHSLISIWLPCKSRPFVSLTSCEILTQCWYSGTLNIFCGQRQLHWLPVVTTWENNDWIFISGWNVPLTQHVSHPEHLLRG